MLLAALLSQSEESRGLTHDGDSGLLPQASHFFDCFPIMGFSETMGVKHRGSVR